MERCILSTPFMMFLPLCPVKECVPTVFLECIWFGDSGKLDGSCGRINQFICSYKTAIETKQHTPYVHKRHTLSKSACVKWLDEILRMFDVVGITNNLWQIGGCGKWGVFFTRLHCAKMLNLLYRVIIELEIGKEITFTGMKWAYVSSCHGDQNVIFSCFHEY